MLCYLQKQGFSYVPAFISPLYERVGRFQDVKAGVVSTYSRKEVVDLSKENARFNFADFSIMNLSAIGADKVLRPCQFGSVNVDKFISDSNEVLRNVQEVRQSAA